MANLTVKNYQSYSFLNLTYENGPKVILINANWFNEFDIPKVLVRILNYFALFNHNLKVTVQIIISLYVPSNQKDRKYSKEVTTQQLNMCKYKDSESRYPLLKAIAGDISKYGNITWECPAKKVFQQSTIEFLFQFQFFRAFMCLGTTD